uniref:hypothetical protein n=1 Tax=Ornithinibacillus halotolerans TaxID=1274357 RepID=UPI0035715902
MAWNVKKEIPIGKGIGSSSSDVWNILLILSTKKLAYLNIPRINTFPRIAIVKNSFFRDRFLRYVSINNPKI